MNFLQLVQRLQSECGVSGSSIVTTVSQTGEAGRLVNWINAAYLDILNKHTDWNFMRGSFSFNTVAGTQTYTYTDAGITSFANWKRDSFRLYLTSLGVSNEMIFPFADYDEFRNLYLYGSMRNTQQRPVFWSIDPSTKSLVLGATPDDIYTVNGEYFKLPTELSGNSDTPLMPTQFHLAIVYGAMIKYGLYEAAQEVIERGQREYTKYINMLEADQLPKIGFGPPLA